MTVLRLQGVGVVWSTSAPLFEGVSLALDQGFFGLVGANGAGKTTLLRVLGGELVPHEGSVALQPRDAIVAYCPQRVDDVGPDVEALALREDGLGAELRGRLALEPSELGRWSTLSPGERKRWQIAAALAREPDVLLLDEPTNHLDEAARRRLIGALTRFKGLGVVVSHDRRVLEELTSSTIRLHERRATLYVGAYDAARAQWESERTARIGAHQAARERVREAAARLDATRRVQESASKGASRSGRKKNKNDSDARSMALSNRAGWAESRAGRVVGVAREELERAKQAVPRLERDPTVGGKIFASYERAPHPVLFHLDRDELCAGGHPVLWDVRLSIGREERVRLEGPNGAGKTTLLEALVASAPRRDRILYLPQELGAREREALTERLTASDPEERGRTLSIFAALGSDPTRVLAGHGDTLSPGEVRKLALAEALGRQVWALVLDEPTNHLDLPSIERLEGALADYPGCVVLVTHDEDFAAQLTERRLLLKDGVVQ